MSIAVVGFDVGCSTSYVAVAKQGGIETILNECSERATPTFVSFTENRRLVGQAAREKQFTNVSNTIFNFTPLLGKLFSENAVKRARERLPYSVDGGCDKRVRIKVKKFDSGEGFLPEQIFAMQLTRLGQIAEENLSLKVTDVVINVPVHYTDSERRAVLDASGIAGMNCVKLVTDISAVGTDYGLKNLRDLPDVDKPPHVVVFVIVGYSSTQVGVCAFNRGTMKVLATCCDPELGGRDFDYAIYSHFVTDFEAKHKLKLSHKGVLKVLQQCERLKKGLSANSQHLSIDVDCVMDEKDLHGSMNRAEFESLCSPLIKRFEDLLKRCLSLGKQDVGGNFTVEMVGGSSRIPILKSTVASVFGKDKINTSLNADEAVARGCALQAAILSPAYKVRDFKVFDACPYPIGLFWKNEDVSSPSLNDSEMDITTGNCESSLEVFPLFHEIPFSKLITFKRKGPFTLEARYLDSAELPNNNTIIGTFTINEIPVQASEESKVRVKVRMDAHGIFSISKAEIAEEYQKEVEVEVDPTPSEMDTSENNPAGEVPLNGDASKDKCNSECDAQNAEAPKQVEQPKPKATVIKTFIRYKHLPIDASVMHLPTATITDFCEAELRMLKQEELEQKRAHAKNAVEEYVYEMRGKLNGALCDFAKDSEREKLLDMLQTAEDWLYEEGQNLVREEYSNKLQTLQKNCAPVVTRYIENMNRDAAVSTFNRLIEDFRKVLDCAAKKDDKYSHLSEEQLSKIQTTVNQQETWLREQVHKQNALPLNHDPVLLTEQIIAQQQVLESTCRPIVNTPKPATPPPPPVAENGKTHKNGETNNKMEEPSSPGKKNAAVDHDSVKPETMDVD